MELDKSLVFELRGFGITVDGRAHLLSKNCLPRITRVILHGINGKLENEKMSSSNYMKII